MVAASRRAAALGARLTVFSELAVCGYPPADFLEKPSFLARCRSAVEELRIATRDLSTAVLAGVALPSNADSGKPAVNAAVLLDRGRLVLEQHKRLLPFYDVFDEQRYFAPAKSQQVVELDGVRLAVTICEDAWNDKNFWPRRLYTADPMEDLMRQNPALHINLSSSPFWHSKRALRREMLAAIARRDGIPVLMCNQVGGNDSLIFDGSSLALNGRGELIAQAASFEEDLAIVDPFQVPVISAPQDDDTEAAYRALVLGTRDYVRKCGFGKVVIGLSGGIDSALVAVLAAEAVGPQNVLGVGMPGPYSSEGSVRDARQLAENLGIEFQLIPITPIFEAYRAALRDAFHGRPEDVAEENLQARARGNLLMALSNKFGSLLLTTGNKSELSVGYCTLYGDMAGGLAVISDVPKTMVYALAEYLNATGGMLGEENSAKGRELIPKATIRKAPSAELRPNQTDQDTLPPYETLDRILRDYIEEMMSPEEITEKEKLPLALVESIARKVDHNEYKRQQAAVGLKITSKAFGIGRKFPIAQAFRSAARVRVPAES